MASGVDNLISKLASTRVEEEYRDKEVSFVGLALTLDTEEDAADIVKAINNCKGMTTLRLDGNTIGIPAAKAIAKALETQPDFKIALWKDMFTRRDKLEIPQALSHLSNGIMVANARLVVLDLSDNAFGPRGLVGIQKLLESPCCYTLEELQLNNNGLGISGAKLLSESICNCIENSRKNGTPMKLKKFICGRNRLENEGAQAVSKFLKQFGTLEYVAMTQNGIYHPGIRHLSEAFSSNPGLRVVNLEDNSLTEEGAKCIANCLSDLPKLEILNLDDCLVRTGGAIAIASALETSCPDLRELRLGFNEIGLEGGEVVADATANKEKLELVNLNGNSFGEEGCDYIGSRFGELGRLEVLGSLSQDDGEEDDDDEDDDDDEEDEEGEKSDEDEKEDGSADIAPAIGGNPEMQLKKNKINDYKQYMSTAPKDFFSFFPKYSESAALIALGESNFDFSLILAEEPTQRDYIDLFFRISLAVDPDDSESKTVACKYADTFLAKAYSMCEPNATDFNDIFLVCIGLLKDEEKKTTKDLNISGTLLVLEHAVKQPYFHASTRHLLQFFLGRPLQYVTVSDKAKHVLMQTLYQL